MSLLTHLHRQEMFLSSVTAGIQIANLLIDSVAYWYPENVLFSLTKSVTS
jgi:hypothetical protein